jgi:hypothetical protein
MNTTLERVILAASRIHFDTFGTAIGGDKTTAIERAFLSRGKYKHERLLSTPPSAFKDPWAFAAWNGLQPNPHKVRIGSMFFLHDDVAAFATMLLKLRTPASMDKDMDALTKLGVW